MKPASDSESELRLGLGKHELGPESLDLQAGRQLSIEHGQTGSWNRDSLRPGGAGLGAIGGIV